MDIMYNILNVYIDDRLLFLSSNSFVQGFFNENNVKHILHKQ